MGKILMIVTSHDRIDDEHKTGLWLDEFAVPYRAFRDAGYDVTVASPRGGKAPVDPRSLEGATSDDEASRALDQTAMMIDVGDAADYDAVFIPGGHGTMWDLATDQSVKTLLSEFDSQGKIVASVCHGPAAFVDAVKLGEPTTLVHGRTITCFTDSEERAAGLDQAVPFLLATKLREQGANVVERDDYVDHIERDGNFITGQNPQSSASAAKAVLEALRTQ